MSRFFRSAPLILLAILAPIGVKAQTVRPTVAIVGLDANVLPYTYGKTALWLSPHYELVDGKAAEGAEYEVRVFDARTFTSAWSVPSVQIPRYGSAGVDVTNTRFRALLALKHRPSGRVLLQTTDGPGGGETTGWGGSAQSHGYSVTVQGYSTTATGAVDDFFRQLRLPAPLPGSGQAQLCTGADGRTVDIFAPSGTKIVARTWYRNQDGSRGGFRKETAVTVAGGGYHFVYNPDSQPIWLELSAVDGVSHWEGVLPPR